MRRQNQINNRPQSAKPGYKGYWGQGSESDFQQNDNANKGNQRKNLKLMKPDLTTNDFARILPKKIYQDKQRLYSQALQLKQSLNETIQQNIRLKTRVSILEKQKDKLTKHIQLGRQNQNMNKANSRVNIYQNKAGEKQNMMIRNLKKMVRQNKEQNEFIKQENVKIKKAIKYTKINELQIQRKMIQDQNKRLATLLEEMNQQLGNQQAYQRQLLDLKRQLEDQQQANKQLNQANLKYMEYIQQLQQKITNQAQKFSIKQNKLQRQAALNKRKMNQALKQAQDLRKQLNGLKNQSTVIKSQAKKTKLTRPMSSNPYKSAGGLIGVRMVTENKKQQDNKENEQQKIKLENEQLKQQLSKTKIKLQQSQRQIKKVQQKTDILEQQRKEKVGSLGERSRKDDKTLKERSDKSMKDLENNKGNEIKAKKDNFVNEEKMVQNVKQEKNEKIVQNHKRQKIQRQIQKPQLKQNRNDDSNQYENEFDNDQNYQDDYQDKQNPSNLQENAKDIKNVHKQRQSSEIDQYRKDFQAEEQEEPLYIKQQSPQKKKTKQNKQIKKKKNKETVAESYKPDKKILSQIKQLLTYRLKAQRYPYEQLKSDIQQANQKQFNFSDLQGMFVNQPFYLNQHYTAALIKYCFQKQNPKQSQKIQKKTLIEKLRKVVDKFVLVEQQEQEEYMRSIAQMVSQYPEQLQSAFDKIKNGENTISRSQFIEMFRNLELQPKYIEIIIQELSLCSNDLDHLNYAGFFQRFYIENMGSLENGQIDQEQMESSSEQVSRNLKPKENKKMKQIKKQFQDDDEELVMDDGQKLSLGNQDNKSYDEADVVSDDGPV